MRSNSVGVLPYDLFLFSVLQELVANELEMDLGTLMWTANSMHVYVKEMDQRVAELNWYRDGQHKQYGQIAAERYKSIVEPMQPLTITLSEARKIYPNQMDTLSRVGPEVTLQDIDEITVLMVLGYPREATRSSQGMEVV